MELNQKELIKQMRENMLRENHARVEIIVNKIPAPPYCNMEIDNVSLKEVGVLYLSLLETIQDIKKQYPLAVAFADTCLDIKSSINVEYDGKKEKKNGK